MDRYMNRYNLVRFTATRVKTIIAHNLSHTDAMILKEKYNKTSKMNKCDYRIEQISQNKMNQLHHVNYMAN